MATTTSSSPSRRVHGSSSTSFSCSRRKKNFVLAVIMAMVAVHVLVMMTMIILTTSGSSSSTTKQQPVPELIQRQQQRQQQQSRLTPLRNRSQKRGRREQQQKVIPQHAATQHHQAPHRHHHHQQQQQNATKTTSDPSHYQRYGFRRRRRSYVLKAYLEEVNRTEWNMEPLPNRSSTARAELLRVVEYPAVNSCRNLAEQWPSDVRDAPALRDPFLPWIHDVFPTADGEYVQFVAQNIRRCDAGNSSLVSHLTPAVANFQHVSVRRVLGIDGNNSNNNEETRYRLTNHSAADSDGVATRFICRFRSHPRQSSSSSSSVEKETLSVFHVDYDWHAYRKRFRFTFKPNETSNTNVLTSQLTFACPVPVELRDQIIIRTGSVSTAANTTTNDNNDNGNDNDNNDNDSNGNDNKDNDNDDDDDDDDDWTNLFVDLIPIRTPPRFGVPHAYFQPRYVEHATKDAHERFDPDRVYGPNHVLPRIRDSGRWENIPVCKAHAPVSPSTYNKDTTGATTTNDRSTNDGNNTSENNSMDPHNNQKDDQSKKKDREPSTVYTTATNNNKKKHRLIACLWASAASSSGTASKNDNVIQTESQRRLLEWITYHTMIGFDHVYVYDNSPPRRQQHHAVANATLKPVTDLFSDEIVTYIRWPAAVCNNNDIENSISPREWSSQSAAESSCRLRYGPAAEWIGQLDIDEYVVPAGNNHTHLHTLLDELERSDIRILSLASFRAKPRFSLIEQPKPSPKHQQRGGEIKDDSPSSICGDANKLPLHVMLSSKKSSSVWSPACFEVRIPRQTTFLQAYNCDVQLPNRKLKRDPAEKQLYRSDFVLQHYVHYATATTYSAMSRQEQKTLLEANATTAAKGQRRRMPKKWKRGLKQNNPYHAWANEETQALLLHTKTVEPRYTAGWSHTCSVHNQRRQETIYEQLKPNQRLQERQLKWICHLGFPWPSRSANGTTFNTATAIAATTTAAHEQQQRQHPNATADGMAYNCHVHERIENYYVPRLERALSHVLLRRQKRQQ